MVTIIPNYQVDKNKIIDPLSLGGKNYVDPKSPLAKPITPIKQIPNVPSPNLLGTEKQPLKGIDTNNASVGVGSIAPMQLNAQENKIFEPIYPGDKLYEPYVARQSQDPIEYMNSLFGISDQEKSRKGNIDRSPQDLAKGLGGEVLGPLFLSTIKAIAPEKSKSLEKFASLELGPSNIKYNQQLKDILGESIALPLNGGPVVKLGAHDVQVRTLGNILVGYNAENLGISKNLLNPASMAFDTMDEDVNAVKREYADRVLYQVGRDIYNLRKEGKLTNELLTKMLVDAELKRGDEIRKLEKTVAPEAKAPNVIYDTIKTAITK